MAREYKKGDKMFFHNKRTNELSEVEITEVKYAFDKRIGGQTNLLTKEEIDEMMEDGRLSLTKESYIESRVKELEKELGIKLERR